MDPGVLAGADGRDAEELRAPEPAPRLGRGAADRRGGIRSVSRHHLRALPGRPVRHLQRGELDAAEERLALGPPHRSGHCPSSWRRSGGSGRGREAPRRGAADDAGGAGPEAVHRSLHRRACVHRGRGFLFEPRARSGVAWRCSPTLPSPTSTSPTSTSGWTGFPRCSRSPARASPASRGGRTCR